MAQRNWANAGRLFAMKVKPIWLDCNFVVDSSNGNGLGIRSLKGACVANVFMHTSTTPGVGNFGITNPNPAAGYIQVQLTDNYARYYGGFSGFVSPVSGTPLTSTTAGLLYTIVSLGTTTAAQWTAAGVPNGIAPAVGVSFIAIATGAIGGTGAVEVPSNSGITSIEVVGDPNTTIAPSPQTAPAGTGGLIYMQTLGSTDASTTTLIAKAPANGSVIGLSFFFSDSSILIGGE